MTHAGTSPPGRARGPAPHHDPGNRASKNLHRKQQQKVKARSLFCFWAVKELGFSLRELARRLELSPPAVGYSVERGEAIARENGYRLTE
jgi:hypothetical protein